MKDESLLIEKLEKFKNKCAYKDSINLLILKNIGDFDSLFVELEDKLKSRLFSKFINYKIFTYDFDNPTEFVNVAKVIKYEDPDIILVLSNTLGSEINKAFLRKLAKDTDILLCKIATEKTPEDELIFDFVFNKLEDCTKILTNLVRIFLNVKRERERKGLPYSEKNPNPTNLSGLINNIFKDFSVGKNLVEEKSKSDILDDTDLKNIYQECIKLQLKTPENRNSQKNTKKNPKTSNVHKNLYLHYGPLEENQPSMLGFTPLNIQSNELVSFLLQELLKTKKTDYEEKILNQEKLLQEILNILKEETKKKEDSLEERKISEEQLEKLIKESLEETFKTFMKVLYTEFEKTLDEKFSKNIEALNNQIKSLKQQLQETYNILSTTKEDEEKKANLSLINSLIVAFLLIIVVLILFLK
jgi:hypothetical protein